MNRQSLFLVALIVTTTVVSAQSPEWPAFRGDGTGVAANAKPPTTWSDTENLAWMRELPGPGSSSPIIDGDRMYVTCYSGYGVDPDEPGEMKNLKRHLICLNRHTGDVIWDKTVKSTNDESPYRGMIALHGYASATPVTDGTHIYAYFGRTGVVAFDRDGEVIWTRNVGKGKSTARAGGGRGGNAGGDRGGNRGGNAGGDRGGDRGGNAGGGGNRGGNAGGDRGGQDRGGRGGRFGGRGGRGFGGGGGGWGSSASPLLHGNLVIVSASDASDTLQALDKKTGEVVWKIENPKLTGGIGASPIAVGEGDNTVIVMPAAGVILAIDPKTGKLAWELKTAAEDAANAAGGNARGGRGGNAGGEDRGGHGGNAGGGRGDQDRGGNAGGGRGDQDRGGRRGGRGGWGGGRGGWDGGHGGGSAPTATPITDGEHVYVFGGMRSSSRALRLGTLPTPKEGDEAAKRVTWSSALNSDVPSPLLHDGRIYVINSRGTFSCLNAADGEVIYRGRLDGRTGQIYASPTYANGHLYVVSRKLGAFVYAIRDDKLELVSKNRYESDESIFHGSAVPIGNKLYLRSDKAVYCIAESKTNK